MSKEVEVSSVFERNLEAYESNVRVIANKGGTRSGKTWSLLYLLLMIAIKAKQATLISIVSESFPHLRRGVLRDFDTILNELGWVDGREYTKRQTDSTYTIGRSVIEFFSADNAGKVHGAQRDILFINECNHIPFEIYRQLAVRTAKTIFLDWNPTSRFWYDDKIVGNNDISSTLIHSTYLDNPFLSDIQVREIESNKGDANWWKVYGLGETGSLDGLIYQNWEQCSDLPLDYKQRWLGCDFGYTNDPTAIVEVRLAHGELWVRELCYERGLLNSDIARLIKEQGLQNVQCVCDSAEPKSVAEMRSYGINTELAIKGADSIRNGIQLLQKYKLNVVSGSYGIIDELKNYQWRKDSNGNQLNEPSDHFNHALDALRYVALNKLNGESHRGIKRLSIR